MIDYTRHAAAFDTGDNDDIDQLALLIGVMPSADAARLAYAFATVPAVDKYPALRAFVDLLADHAARTGAQELVENLNPPEPTFFFEPVDDPDDRGGAS